MTHWSLGRVESTLRDTASQHIYLVEAALYLGVAILLAAAATVVTFEAGAILWRGTAQGTLSKAGLPVLDQLLLVLMLVEVLHTVRMSIRSEELMLLEPFLIVGMIASIRRILVITLQAAALTTGVQANGEADTAFRNAMVELGLLGVLVLTLVFSIYLLRRASPEERTAVKQ